MKFYSGKDFDEFARALSNEIVNEILSQSDTYILNVNVDDFANHLVQKYELDMPEIHFDNTTVDSVEREIPASMFPRFDFRFFDMNVKIRKQVIVYHIPYSGEINLLELTPNPCVLRGYECKVDLRLKNILIEVIDFYGNSEKIIEQFNEKKGDILSNYNYLKINITSFNKGLPQMIIQMIENRKQQLLNKNNLLASLGVPIKKKEGVAETFSVPKPKLKEKIIIKPVVYDKEFKPEPTLDESNYRKILKIINDVGKNFERLPSTYMGKSEEDIRDFILFTLDPNFELGSASGETFNKTGKTDILLRYDSNVVFVAECKYWKGEKNYLKTIDQLLGYLTWRNSKIAVINFVQNNEITEVLGKIKSATKTHSNFLKELNVNDENWFNYKMHLNGDRNRELDLAIISFHLPK